MVFLDACRLLDDTVVGPGDLLAKEGVPFGIGEGDPVQRFQLAAQVCDQVGFARDPQVLAALPLKGRL